MLGFCAVWRRVLGVNDAIDGVDIVLGKCNDTPYCQLIYLKPYALVMHC